MKRLRKWLFGGGEMLITEERGVRFLHIGGGAIQSAMRLSAPDSLELHYTRALMSFLLFRADPRHVVVVGLGGGSIPKFLYRNLPDACITAVEIDERVVRASREYFNLPADDERLRVTLDDGANWVRAHPGGCDVLVMDAFDDSEQVESLVTEAFYRSAHDCLRPGGVLVANFMAEDPMLDLHRERMGAAFGGKVLKLRALDGVNAILMALRDGPVRVGISPLRERARDLAEAFGLPFERLVGTMLDVNPHTAQYLKFPA